MAGRAVAAVETWPTNMPKNPSGWLVTVARRKALDRLRREAARPSKQLAASLAAATGPEPTDTDGDLPDHRLGLIFTCCHPALRPDARVALTLRALGGLTTAEIARAFLVPEATMAKRLVRAKAKIRQAGIPYGVPPAADRPARVASVLQVVYSIFTEGHLATAGPSVLRGELCEEAIRLGRVLRELLPEDPEVAGLLALMLLHHARRAARSDDRGDIVRLADQDRGRWDAELIAEGAALVDGALRVGRPGPFQVEAAIAALHARSPHPDATDWPQIAGLYAILDAMAPSPVVGLNRAIAVSMADGPAVALPMIDRLEPQLAEWHLFHAARADLLERVGRADAAVAAAERALALASAEPDRRLLARRVDELVAQAEVL